MDLWASELRRWPTLVFVAFGLASNILTVLVLCRRKLRKNSCSLYLIGASVSNSICIFTGLLYYVLSAGFGYYLTTKSRLFCKVLPFVYYSTLFLASWFILLACGDRFCSTHSKVFIRQYSSIYIAKRLLIILPILSLLIHCHILIFMDWIRTGMCSFITFPYLLFIYIYYVVVYAFMTPILYGIFAVLTIYNVRKTKRTILLVVQRIESSIKLPKRHQTLNAQLLRMLLVQVISFVILTMPLAAWNLYTGVSYYWTKSSTTRSLESLLSVIFRILNFINIGSTLVVYTITARVFREELRALFRCQWIERTFQIEQHFALFSFSRRIAPIA